MARGADYGLVAFAVLLCIVAMPAGAQEERGNWELTLAATGTSSKSFDNDAIGVNAGIGYFFLDYFELSLRQLGSYVKVKDGGSAGNGATQVALDFQFPLGSRHQWAPFIGGNAGYFYGDTFTDTFEYAPEAGVKYFVNDTTFIYFRVEYQIFAKDFTGTSNSADRQFTYMLGIGLRF